jgi:hypothetical protein
MINRLLLTSNAYFYKVKKSISKAAISRILTAASANKDGHALFTEVRQALNVSGESFQVSLIVFKREVPPPFLIPDKEMEIHHCYLFLVEYDQLLIVSKRGTAEFIDLIEKKIDTLNYQEITGLKVDSSTQFVKVGVANMDTTATAMRRAVYEGQDLKNNLPPISTSNKIITTLKVKNRGKDSSLAPGTSRINDLGKRETVNFFCYWAATQCKQIKAFTPTHSYLDNFAQRLDFRTYIKDLKVMSILFNLAPILEGLGDESIAGIYFLDSHSRDRIIDLKTLSETHDLCLKVSHTKGSKNHPIQTSIDNSLTLRQLTEGFAIHSDKLDRINVAFATGETISLLHLINRYNLYIVSFNHADIRFSGKTLFRDSKLLTNLPYFLESFETNSVFTSIKSEKGDPTPTCKKFDSDSLFGVIESQFSTDCDFLFCDDLGNEWADYIGFRENQFIRFYHAKFSNKNFSASAFQEVVAQALKNLGNFNFNQNLDTKTKKVKEKYSTSNIPRFRKGKSKKAFMKDLQSTFNFPQTRKELVIVVNFMSKKELDTQLNLLTKGKAKNEAVQILWLLSTLFRECISLGISPKVLTRP